MDYYLVGQCLDRVRVVNAAGGLERAGLEEQMTGIEVLHALAV